MQHNSRNVLDDFIPERRRRRRRAEVKESVGLPALAETDLPLLVINRLEAHGVLTVDALGDLPDDVIYDVIKVGAPTRRQVYDLLVAHGRRLSPEDVSR